MKEKLVLRLLSISIVFISGLVIIYQIIYYSIFRFDTKSLTHFLESNNSIICTTFSNCDLKLGDILVRRYMTDRTRMITNMTNVYFNHTAFYMGSGMIFEAVGTEKDSNDDIVIHPLMETDWTDRGVEQLLVIRPKYTFSQLSEIKINLEQIAQDPEYRFGIPLFGEKKTYCSEVIYLELSKAGIIPNLAKNLQFITPDFLIDHL